MTIKAEDQQFWALQHLHNHTGSFISDFSTDLTNETPINPTADGIVFFRPQDIHNLETQVSSYKAVHTVLKDVGGLSGVIVFGESAYGEIDQAVYIATKVKEFDSSIKTVLIDDSVNNFLRYEEGVFSTPPSESLQSEFGRGFSPIHMIASRDNVSFGVADTFHAEAVERTKTLEADFVLAGCFDGVIAGHPRYMNKDFQKLVGVETNDSPPQKDALLRFSFQAKDDLLGQLPAFSDVEKLVKNDADQGVWDEFTATLS